MPAVFIPIPPAAVPPHPRNRGAGITTLSDDVSKRGKPDRSKITMHDDREVHYWTKHLGISREDLQRAVDKVGNSAAAVQKELGHK